MKAVIKIKTNRIYFEQFVAPCGGPEVSEIKMAWEQAIVDVIESSGFLADIEIGVGYYPAVQKIVSIEAGDECDCDNESPDCECQAKEELPELIALCEKYAQLIADKATDAGYDAAAAKSDEFVKASELPDT